MKQVILITGASSGFGSLTAHALAEAGHTVYASMRGTGGNNADKVVEAAAFSRDKGIDPRTIELDVGLAQSANDAVARIVAEHGRIDVMMHNAGQMMYGSTEAFTPEQLAQQYDVNVLSTQRVIGNVAVLKWVHLVISNLKRRLLGTFRGGRRT